LGGGDYAAKRQSDIAWGFQPQDPVSGGLRHEGARGKPVFEFTASLQGACCYSLALGLKTPGDITKPLGG